MAALLFFIERTFRKDRNKAGINAWNIGFAGRGAQSLEESYRSLRDRNWMQIRYFLRLCNADYLEAL